MTSVNGGDYGLGHIIGGYVNSGAGNATGNTVTLGGGLNLAGVAVYGGVSKGAGDVVTGNTLGLNGFSGAVNGLRNFRNYDIVVTSGINGGSLVSIVDGALAPDLAGATITITAIQGGSNLTRGGEFGYFRQGRQCG